MVTIYTPRWRIRPFCKHHGMTQSHTSQNLFHISIWIRTYLIFSNRTQNEWYNFQKWCTNSNICSLLQMYTWRQNVESQPFCLVWFFFIFCFGVWKYNLTYKLTTMARRFILSTQLQIISRLKTFAQKIE